jgi:N-methylhydantoinase A
MLRIGIDIGGTFTDFAAWRDDGDGTTPVLSLKVPSTPADFAEGFRTGFEAVLASLPPCEGESVYVLHGTTVSTNTVIERSGACVALLTTRGFKDLLELARLRLRQPLNLFETRTRPLVPRHLVYEIDERMLADGSVDRPVDLEDVARAAIAAREAGATAVACAFLHSYRNPAHEHAVRDFLAMRTPGLEVSLSSDIWPRVGEYERAMICVLNAYVARRMNEYLGRIDRYLASRLAGVRLFTTRSNGGAMSAAEALRRPVHTLLSGPASGVTAVQFLGRAVGINSFLTMDMGGTSTDLSLVRDGEPTIAQEGEVGDFPLMMPVTAIEAIGAGGGSLAWMDGPLLRVGPNSAGARPGPACFGHGGEKATITDAYLLCGYLDPAKFLGGRLRLDRDAAQRAMQPVAQALGTGIEDAAEAVIAVATSNMVAAVLPYLARAGVEPELLTLIVYGGAGALHGPLLAAEIGVRQVLVPATPSVFCAFGGLVSDLVHDTFTSVHGLPMDGSRLQAAFAQLEDEARAWLAAQAPARDLVGVRIARSAEMRYRGQSWALDVVLDPQVVASGTLADAEALFHAEHERLYARADRTAPVEWLGLRVRIHGGAPAPRIAHLPPATTVADTARTGTRGIRVGGGARTDAGIYARDRLAPGHRIAGAAIIEQADATILVPPAFEATVTSHGNLLLECTGSR